MMPHSQRTKIKLLICKLFGMGVKPFLARGGTKVISLPLVNGLPRRFAFPDFHPANGITMLFHI